MTLGQQLKQMRVIKGVLQKDVAKAIGCNPQYISVLEGDRVEPSREFLRKLTDYYGWKLIFVPKDQ